MTTYYWTEEKLNIKVRCDTCKYFESRAINPLATRVLRGNENAEHMNGKLLYLCDRHYIELKEAGEIE